MPSPDSLRRTAEHIKNPVKKRRLLAEADREELRRTILKCQRCDLGETSNRQRWKRVPWRGSHDSPLAIVGEAPGRDEVLQGKPFVGRSRHLLDLALGESGLDLDPFIVNTIACRPPDDNYQVALDMGAGDACRPHFNGQLDISKAWFVLLVGARAYKAVLEDRQTITQARGKPQWVNGRFYMATWHPAYAMRKGDSSSEMYEFKQDVRSAVRMVESGTGLPRVKIEQVLPDEVDRAAPHPKMREVINKNGWVALTGTSLGRRIVVVDEGAAKKGKTVVVPDEYADWPQWTTHEIAKIRKPEGGWYVGRQDLERINLVKRHLGGEVVA